MYHDRHTKFYAQIIDSLVSLVIWVVMLITTVKFHTSYQAFFKPLSTILKVVIIVAVNRKTCYNREDVVVFPCRFYQLLGGWSIFIYLIRRKDDRMVNVVGFHCVNQQFYSLL